MAMNPQNVLSSLRMMSDQQLQQYAAMHKNDPFIFPLAFQESQTRKQIRSESQAMQPPQPKVAEQALAAMAAEPMPEEVGIGALPAKNLEGMAAGGIVAFDEGGEVPRYQGLGPSLVRTPQPTSLMGDIPGFESGSILADAKAKYAAGRPLSSVEKALLFSAAPLAAAGDVLVSPLTGMANLVRNPLDKSPRPSMTPFSDARSRALYGDQTAPAAPPMQMGSNLGATDASLGAAGVAALAAGRGGADKGGADKGGAAPTDGTGLRPGGGYGFKPGEGLGLGTRPSTYSAELGAMQPQGEVKSPFESQIRAAGLAETKAAQEYKELREKQMQEAGLAGIDQERRLKAREEKLAKTEGDLSGMALLKAGMAIMSGSSPFALQNIGSGAQVGIEEYTKGREKIDAARERLDDAFDRLEQVRRGELVMNQKEQAQLQRDVNKTIAQTEKDVLAGAREAYGWRKADTLAAFNAYVADRRTNAELMSRERLGIAQIGAQERIAGQRNRLMQDLYGGEAKARKDFGAIQTKVMGELSKDMNYQMATPAAKAIMERDRLMREIGNNPFLAPYAAGIGFTKAPPPGKVFDLTE